MADAYVCTLTEQSLEVAKKELNEDPRERESAVQTFREWIQSQPHLRCDTSTSFLLRFLRSAKFSQLAARTRLDNWLTSLEHCPGWLRDVDTCSEKLHKFMDSGYCLALPGLDKQGRKIMLIRQGCLDTSGKYYDNDFVMKAQLGLYMTLIGDENIQVNGLLYFMDFTGFEMRHLTFYGIEDMKRITKIWQKAFPGRFKGFEIYNAGPVFETLMSVTRPLLTKKFKERLHVHGSNLENIYKVIPMEMLPKEYLPDDYKGKSAGTIAEVIEHCKDHLRKPEIRDRVRHETSAVNGVDESKRLEDEPQESFRRLNVE